MILKEAGIFGIDKLQTIVLFEADFNMNNKFYRRQMMHHCLDTSQMSQEQYSGPREKSIDHALNKRLVFDITRYKKNTTTITSCDLRSCFDRVAHVPATLVMASSGIPQKHMFSMFHTIQNTDFTTRTAYSDSEATFGGKEGRFIAKPQTLGQGNGTGPQVWAIVSNKMSEVLRKSGLATRVSAPISKKNVTIIWLHICGPYRYNCYVRWT